MREIVGGVVGCGSVGGVQGTGRGVRCRDDVDKGLERLQLAATRCGIAERSAAAIGVGSGRPRSPRAAVPRGALPAPLSANNLVARRE